VAVAADAVAGRYELDHELALRRMERAGVLLTTVRDDRVRVARHAAAPQFKAVSRLVQDRTVAASNMTHGHPTPRFPAARPRRLRYTARPQPRPRDELMPDDFICRCSSEPAADSDKKSARCRTISTVGGPPRRRSWPGPRPRHRSYILFGIPAAKDAEGRPRYPTTASFSSRSASCAGRSPTRFCLIADECFCEYTDHGHCGILTDHGGGRMDVDNDAHCRGSRRNASATRGPGRCRGPEWDADGMVRRDPFPASTGRLQPRAHPQLCREILVRFLRPSADAAESPPQFGDRSS